MKLKGGILLSLFEFFAVILFAIFSNYIYQQQAIKAVKKLKIEITDEKQPQAYLLKKGGGSSGSVWLYVLIAFVVGGIEWFLGML